MLGAAPTKASNKVTGKLYSIIEILTCNAPAFTVNRACRRYYIMIQMLAKSQLLRTRVNALELWNRWIELAFLKGNNA